MCRFKSSTLTYAMPNVLCFNTSYVSVQGSNLQQSRAIQQSFNTSYVSVQESSEQSLENLPLFQYILCVGSRRVWKRKRVKILSFNTSYVSVQDQKVMIIPIQQISFNTSYVSVQGKAWYKCTLPKRVSIHPMCRFKNLHLVIALQKVCFNTSYVSVQVALSASAVRNLKFQYILCVGSRVLIEHLSRLVKCVSIHPMCRFKLSVFFYCFNCTDVSIHPMCRFKVLLLNPT